MQDTGREMKGSVWTYLKDYDCTYGVPPKNASSSFYEALRRHYKLKRSKGLQYEPNEKVERVSHPVGARAFFIVRHPIDRFESLWRSKCRDGHGKAGGHEEELYGLTPEELLAYIQANDDPHWRKQVVLYGNQEREDIILVPVERFADHFGRVTGIEMWHQNPTHGLCPMSLELEDAVRQHYKHDLLLYYEALRNYHVNRNQ